MVSTESMLLDLGSDELPTYIDFSPIRPKSGEKFIFEAVDKLIRSENWKSDGYYWFPYATKRGTIDGNGWKKFYYKTRVKSGSDKDCFSMDFRKIIFQCNLFPGKTLVIYQGPG